MAALAEGQVAGEINNHVVGPNGIGVAPVEARVERIGGSGDSKRLFRERLVELILGLKGETGRDPADHAKLSLAKERYRSRFGVIDVSEWLIRPAQFHPAGHRPGVGVAG